MSDLFSDLVKQLSSKSDWAIVLPVALTSFTVDAATTLIPATMLSPAACGFIAGGVALSVKRAVEAVRQRRLDKDRLHVAYDEAGRVASDLADVGLFKEAQALRFEMEMTDDLKTRIDAIRRARAKL